MFNKHLFKVIAGFCGMILLGLISLVIINSLKSNNVQAQKTTVLPSVEAQTSQK
jgi:hypothetical protein